MPNPYGSIVPIYETYDNGTTKYNCDFLRAYSDETVILHLPGDLTTKDVFWLSVFCIPYAISFAHVYLPYNDIYPPKAMHISTVKRCKKATEQCVLSGPKLRTRELSFLLRKEDRFFSCPVTFAHTLREMNVVAVLQSRNLSNRPICTPIQINSVTYKGNGGRANGRPLKVTHLKAR